MNTTHCKLTYIHKDSHTHSDLERLPTVGRCACLSLGCGNGKETPTITAVTQACLLRAAA